MALGFRVLCVALTQRRLFCCMCLSRRLCLAMVIILRARVARRCATQFLAGGGIGSFLAGVSRFPASLAFLIPRTSLRFAAVVAIERLDRFGLRLPLIIGNMQIWIVFRGFKP